MNSTKIDPKYISKSNPRVGLIALASDFMIERDFIKVIKDLSFSCDSFPLVHLILCSTNLEVSPERLRLKKDRYQNVIFGGVEGLHR